MTNLDQPQQQQQEGEFKRTLTLPDILIYGVACSVGSGIYSLIGIGATVAGPGVTLSFLLCGIACVFTSFAYAEFASRNPVAGSAYKYVFLSFGEFPAWAVGWNLTLGYGVSSAVAARSWASYLGDWASLGFEKGGMLAGGLDWLMDAPLPFVSEYRCVPLAMVIVGMCTFILMSGAKESTRFNNIMTAVNLSGISFVVFSGFFYENVREDNLRPFIPHGMSGVAEGAGLVFFAYLGFDMVACLSEEVKNPTKNMPLGIVGSLLISMAIYVSVAFVIVGTAPISLLGWDVPVTNSLLANACCTHDEQLEADALQTCLSDSCDILNPVLFYGSRLVELGAVFGLTTSTFTGLMGQPRIFYSMAKDGMISPIFSQIDEITQVPVAGTLITGIFVALTACFINLDILANMISLGSLQVFTFVNAGIIILRMSPQLQPEDASSARQLGAPAYLTLVFTCSVLIASFSISHEWNTGITVMSAILSIITAVYLTLLPKPAPIVSTIDYFQCPLVPIIPLMGIACNVYMMGAMPVSAWVSISLWISCGCIYYFGFKKATNRNKKLIGITQQTTKSSELDYHWTDRIKNIMTRGVSELSGRTDLMMERTPLSSAMSSPTPSEDGQAYYDSIDC